MDHMTHYLYTPDNSNDAYDLREVKPCGCPTEGWSEITFADRGLGRTVVRDAEITECSDPDCLHSRVVEALEAARYNGDLAFTSNTGRADAERRVWLAARPQ